MHTRTPTFAQAPVRLSGFNDVDDEYAAFNGLAFTDLHEDDQRSFESYVLHTVLIKKETEAEQVGRSILC